MIKLTVMNHFIVQLTFKAVSVKKYRSKYELSIFCGGSDLEYGLQEYLETLSVSHF